MKNSFSYFCCIMRKFWMILLAVAPLTLNAQDKWDLRRCVDYAMKNNISVKQADVQARISALQLKQAQWNKIPTASFSTGVGAQFGRSIDPTSNQFTTSQFLYQNYQLQGGASIYQFGRLKNAVLAADYNTQAAQADVLKTANDVALNVANYYLQVLAANEQVKIAGVQIAQTKEQYDNTKKRVDAGALPELNLVELESQLATDSSNLITARTTLEQNILFLKALLNLDMAADFDVDIPPVDKIPVEPIAEMQPEYVYNLAKVNQPEIKAADLRIKGSEKTMLSNKASLLPSLGGFYSLGSTYNNQAQSITGTSVIPDFPIGKVSVNGTEYQVTSLQPYTNYKFAKTHYFKQLDNNFSQAVGLSINIPIFSNGAGRISVENARLSLQNAQLQREQVDQTLKSNIYNAFANALAALQKFNAGIRTVEASQKAYDFSVKRYDVGLLSTLDLITTQNNLLRAKLQQVVNQFDYVFKMKVLEFYKGQGIKL